MKEKIKEIIEDVTGEAVEDTTEIIEEGILDSFDIVTLVIELNDAFGVKIQVSELLPENFANVLAIEKLIKSLQ
ncbi:MAG: phosphopantetheine-binding protein [Eubacteriales bacterium]|jgi:D-alanine--poly(phosphoribitol) ligase subunit 2|uniref:Phosphopantetheine-binding protein n=1 Tax=Fenollaria massiliensis TaxID=938288 RepID=A0A9E7IUR9_9FIRM|nr:MULTISPECIES: phosphopantetheine-binding protein [Fenollaria]MDD7340238.1 phosphopantetheine-binding protein [Eubacteriales bacterium]MDY3105526.1 phosphopantetheine-binding protein [Fenollaria sp.]OFK80357.1 acyl carrier protein [Anaerosphaera sp. HMSC064C01]UQK59228.1 phosphopantetheine-binding protein [Fenollaria massiliensis]